MGNPFNLPEIFGYRNFLWMRTENHVLRSNFFVSRYAKNSWKPLLCFRIFGISKTFMHITVFLRFFCLTISKNFLRSHLMFQKVSNVRYRIKFMQLNDMSRFSVENFPSQGDERFRCGTLWYIRKVRLSKNFMPKRVISLFSVEFMSRLLPIKLAAEPLCDPGFLGHRKISCSVGCYRDSPLIFFGLTVLKNFVGNAFNLSKILGNRNFICMRTENHVLQSNFFVSQYQKKSC